MASKSAPAILPSLVPLTEAQSELAGQWVPLTQRLASESRAPRSRSAPTRSLSSSLP